MNHDKRDNLQQKNKRKKLNLLNKQNMTKYDKIEIKCIYITISKYQNKTKQKERRKKKKKLKFEIKRMNKLKEAIIIIINEENEGCNIKLSVILYYLL